MFRYYIDFSASSNLTIYQNISKEETFEKIKLLCFRQNKATLATNEMLGWNKKPRRNWC